MASQLTTRDSEHCWWPICIYIYIYTIGSLDGTHIKIKGPYGDERAYVNRHHDYSLNVQLHFYCSLSRVAPLRVLEKFVTGDASVVWFFALGKRLEIEGTRRILSYGTPPVRSTQQEPSCGATYLCINVKFSSWLDKLYEKFQIILPM